MASAAAVRILPLALASGPPTPAEFNALEAAWTVTRAAAEATAYRMAKHELAAGMALANNAGQWSVCKQNSPIRPLRRANKYQSAMAKLEGTALGEPVRLRAEISLLENWLALERHRRAGHALVDLRWQQADPEIAWVSPSQRWIGLHWRLGEAFAARLALRLAVRWHQAGTLPEQWEPSQAANPPLPDPNELGRGMPKYERRPIGFRLWFGMQRDREGKTPPPLAKSDLIVDFPAPAGKGPRP
jgi:hypothetical protein